MKKPLVRTALAVAVAAVAGVSLAAPGPGNAVLVSVGESGAAGGGDAYEGTVSNNGRFVAWHTTAADLGPADGNGTWDIALRDLRRGTVEVASVDGDGNPGDGASVYPAMSGNGRWIVYQTDAASLAAGASAGIQVMLYDARTGLNREISVATDGGAGNGACDIYSCRPVSANGRWIVFTSTSTNMVDGTDSAYREVFLADARTGVVSRLRGDGTPPDGDSFYASISPNGRWVVFNSDATNLDPDVVDDNRVQDVFLHDVKLGTTRLVSRAAGGTGPTGNDHSGNGYASAVDNAGRRVVFSSKATNLDAGFVDGNGVDDVFLADLVEGTTRLLSRTPTGGGANGPSGNSAIDPAGRIVTFRTQAGNLLEPAGGMDFDQVFHDIASGVNSRMLEAVEGGPVNGQYIIGLQNGMSANGRWFCVEANGTNAVASGPNGAFNVYLVDLKR